MEKHYRPKIFAALATMLTCVALQAQEPEVWLKADKKGGEWQAWEDVSGNGNDARANFYTYSLKQVNYNPSVDFSAINDTVTVDYNIANKGYIKVFTVFSGVSDTTGEQYIWSFGNIERQSLELGSQKLHNHPKTYRYTGGNIEKPIISIVDRYNSNNGAINPERFFIGNGFEDSVISGGFTGRIAEIIVFDEEQEAVGHRGFESYLAIKYGICLYKDYYGSDGGVIWSRESNEGFSENVFALGRNDDFGLGQKQSTSAESNVLAVAANVFEAGNASNLSNLRDGTYLFFSENGKDSNEGLTFISNGAGYFASNKIWKACEVGSKMHRTPMVFKVNTTRIFDTLTGGFCLIRDANKDGGFSEIETVQPDSISTEGLAYFSGLKLCSSQSGVDYFTFAQASPLTVETAYAAPACDSVYGSATLTVKGGPPPYAYKLSGADGTVLGEWQGTQSTETIDSLAPGSYIVGITDKNGHRYAFKTGDNLEVETPGLGIGTIYSYTGSPIKIDLCESFGKGACAWFFGSTEISDSCSVSLETEGGYTVEVETGGCLVSEEFYVLDNTSTEDAATASLTVTGIEGSIAISPNPARKSFDIEIRLDGPSHVCLYITDITGAAVENKELGNTQQYTYHGKIKTPGTYIISIVSGNKKIATKKLIVQ